MIIILNAGMHGLQLLRAHTLALHGVFGTDACDEDTPPGYARANNVAWHQPAVLAWILAAICNSGC